MRPRPPAPPLPERVSVEDALDLLLGGRAPLPPRRVPIREAAGLVLAEPVVAPGDRPARATALRDGWAVRAEATIGASPYNPAWLPEAPRRVRAGEALPAGADAVLPCDAVLIEAGPAQALLAAAPGEGVRRAGEDARAGAVLLAACRPLAPLDLAVALAAGVETCAVRRPRLRLVAGPGEPGGALLAALAREAGAVLVSGPADLVVVVGESDRAVAPLAGGLALRPGEGAVPGRVEGVPALLVPPGLDAALASGLLVLGPLLRRLSGRTGHPPPWPGILTRKIASTIGFTELALLRRIGEGFEPVAAGDLPLAALAAAEAWIALPPHSEGWAAGTPIEAIPLRPIPFHP